MKDNYSEMNVDMEQILLNKNYDDLSATELEEIKDFVSSKEEFNIMKNTLMNVKTSFGVEEEIEPVDSAKENLMKMFEQKHGKVIPMNKPRPFYLNPVFQIGIAALFILGIIYFYPKGENESMTAMNESKDEVKTEDEEVKETESASVEESTEAPAEETVELKEMEKVAELKKEEPLEEKAIDNRYKSTVVTEEVNPFAKADVSKDVTPKTATDGLAKGEGGISDKELSNLKTDANRSSTKKEKAKEEKSANEDLAEDASVNTTSTLTFSSVATGGVAVADELATSGKREEEKDADKKDGKTTRTNTAGGYYMQPGKPAADLKEGVSLKDEPALVEFLFTAL